MKQEKSPAANRAGGDVTTVGDGFNAPIIPQRATEHNPPNMLEKALWYARRGYAVIPLHAPLFGHPKGYRCSCEEWRHSEKCSNPWPSDKHCPDSTAGKHPRFRDWETKATTDERTIRKWWKWWPDANIGIACGPSGLLVLDRDTYKEQYQGDALSGEDEETVTVLTGGGGEHLWFRRPEGKGWGNGTKGLPPGIDIRGVGGLVVAPPSLHSSGRRYAFELGYSLSDMEPKPVPETLGGLLDQAQDGARGQAVVFAQELPRPDLNRWNLSDTILDYIRHVRPKGGRSEADFAVCAALAQAGATDDEIRAIFQHYPIGTEGKYAERGDGYLSRTLGNARAKVTQNPRPDQVRAEVARVRQLLKRISFADYVPSELQSATGYRTDSTDTKVADALMDLVAEWGSWRVRISLRDLALRAGLGSPMTARAALARLEGWFVEREENGWFRVVARRLDTITLGGDRELSNLRATTTYTTRKADDPFLTGCSRRAKILGNEEPGLGESILRVVDALEVLGQATRRELAAYTGKTASAVARATRRAQALGILEAVQEHRRAPKVYSLAPDWTTVVERLEPRLKTYMLGIERQERAAEALQQYTQRLLAEERLTLPPEERERLERRQAQAQAKRVRALTLLWPDWTLEEVIRWVLTPSTPRTPSPAVLEERRAKVLEGLMVRASDLLGRQFLTGRELVKLRHTLGRLGETLSDWADFDDAEGQAFAYARTQS